MAAPNVASRSDSGERGGAAVRAGDSAGGGAWEGSMSGDVSLHVDPIHLLGVLSVGGGRRRNRPWVSGRRVRRGHDSRVP